MAFQCSTPGPDPSPPSLARARVCATCKKSNAEGDKKMAEAGLVRCADMRPWEWMPGHGACRFEPVRWTART